jgi:hypothetical protein
MIGSSMGPAEIHPYRREDADQAARLYKRIFLPHRPGDRGQSAFIVGKSAFIDRFFTQALFDNPWASDDLPSFVQRSADGRVTGFYGVMPRQMTFDGAPIRVAVGNAFMVEPGARPGGLGLARRYLRGPQDMSIGEGALDAASRIHEGLGFLTYPSRSVNWFRVYRPSRTVTSRLMRSSTASHRLLARFAAPVGDLLDRGMRRVPELTTQVEAPRNTRSRPLTVSELLRCIDAASQGRRLRPVYDEQSLAWVIDLRKGATHRGSFEMMAVEDSKGNPLGWYLCHLQQAGVSEIVQIEALDGPMELVLGRALFDCMRRGSAMVQGRLETALLKPALLNECFFRPAAWLNVHSNNPEIYDAFEAEDVFLSPLENELPW